MAMDTETAPARTPAESNLEILVRESRELLDFLEKKGLLESEDGSKPTFEIKNNLILEHLSTDLSDYGIPVWEWFDISEEDAKAVITRTLALPEYNEE